MNECRHSLVMHVTSTCEFTHNKQEDKYNFSLVLVPSLAVFLFLYK